MIETLAFKTKARTIDHLGREQIADCPTAISELWKNAYDAYARAVGLHIFDGETPIAAIFDDGHGMNYDDFINRWLVVGTESKYDEKVFDEEERNGLSKRTKQGQKGIGRLSSANLGPLLLLISKRKDQDFIATLIDWRIFENPFLTLSDIKIPVTQFDQKEALFGLLPQLFDSLANNVWSTGDDKKRNDRLKVAWDAYDHYAFEQDPEAEKPSDKIIKSSINARFEPHHLDPWSVWSEDIDHGTALLVSDINYDLRAQLPSIEADGAVDRIRDGFFETLSAFTDPYVSDASNEANAQRPDITYEVQLWLSKDKKRTIIGTDRFEVDRPFSDDMEHVISGNVDENGVFTGCVKAFGIWRADGAEYVIQPPKDYTPPKGPTTFVGPLGLHLSAFEMIRSNSTHSDIQHAHLKAIADRYAGFFVYRNGLRVLPYGRVDNDFFEIEQRRSEKAGREFWNARRMFGRISISREVNPNLRDKAGREGFIDNRAAKALRALTINILMTVARQHFGSDSDIRKTELPTIQEKNQKDKAEQERKYLAKRNRKQFQGKLKRNLPAVIELVGETQTYMQSVQIKSEAALADAQAKISEFDERLSALRVSGAPSNLASSEEDYREFRDTFVRTQQNIASLTTMRREAIERIKPAKPEEIAEQQLNRFAGQINARLRGWRRGIDTIQSSERERVEAIYGERTKLFHEQAQPVVTQVKEHRLELDDALEQMSALRVKLDSENEEIFQSYLEALELLSENINIELIARQGTADNTELRDELNRMNQLAQLGITVEILGHEFHTNTQLIRSGLNRIKTAGSFPGTEQIEHGFENLSQQLEFLSPLKVSGPRTRREITGSEIVDYLNSFFETVLSNRGIKIEVSKAFEKFSVHEQPTRLLPVFVNLANNSIYWLVNSRTSNPTIRLDIVDEKVMVSDNGPGVDGSDQGQLFKLFFTRKVSGGRGIGLYLCRVNLLAGGHSIRYATEKDFQLLSGANFVIQLKGAEFD